MPSLHMYEVKALSNICCIAGIGKFHHSSVYGQRKRGIVFLLLSEHF